MTTPIESFAAPTRTHQIGDSLIYEIAHHSPSFLAHLIESLQLSVGQVTMAICALGDLSSEDHTQLFLRALEDPNLCIQEAGIQALLRHDQAVALPILKAKVARQNHPIIQGILEMEISELENR